MLELRPIVIADVFHVLPTITCLELLTNLNRENYIWYEELQAMWQYKILSILGACLFHQDLLS